MKDPVLDPNVFGYVGVIIPAKSFYQAFMLDQRLNAQYRRTLTETQEQMRQLRTMNRFAGTSLPEVVAGGGEMSEEDLQLMGGLSAALVEVMLMGMQQPGMETSVAAYGGALGLHLKQKFFWVLGSPAEEGMRTSVEVLRARTPQEAREAFKALPLVGMLDALRLSRPKG